MEKLSKQINEPSHYTQQSVECINFTTKIDGATANVFKYVWRMGNKEGEPPVKDLGKALYYAYVAEAEATHLIDHETSHLLITELTTIAHEFDPETFAVLVATLAAAAGDYRALSAWRVRTKPLYNVRLAKAEAVDYGVSARKNPSEIWTTGNTDGVKVKEPELWR